MGSWTPEKACKHVVDDIRAFPNEEDQEPCKISCNLGNYDLLMTDAGRRVEVYKQLDKGISEQTNAKVCWAAAKGVRSYVPCSGRSYLGSTSSPLHRKFQALCKFWLEKPENLNMSMTICSPSAHFHPQWVNLWLLIWFPRNPNCWEQAVPDGGHNYFVSYMKCFWPIKAEDKILGLTWPICELLPASKTHLPETRKAPKSLLGSDTLAAWL